MKNNPKKVSNNSFFEIIKNLLSEKESFFCYRLPNSNVLSISFGSIKKLKRSEINENGTFIMPFSKKNYGYMLSSSFDYETLIEKKLYSKKKKSLNIKDFVKKSEEIGYKSSVKNLVKEINRGKLSKIVFSKKITFDNSNTDSVSIFKNILDLYNEGFCYLFFTPNEGFWMGASPELLFKKEGNSISTMALAGTKFNVNSKWGEKEYSEQKIVQDEIFETLNPLCSSLSSGKTETISAGKIQHLRTNFVGKTKASISQLINALFPTSAIAGYPRSNALKLISEYESYERSFYSGFLGFSKDNKTSLFVNLRCLNITNEKTTVYVGSGITKDSIPENEWEEILKKSETMINALF